MWHINNFLIYKSVVISFLQVRPKVSSSVTTLWYFLQTAFYAGLSCATSAGNDVDLFLYKHIYKC